MNVAKVDVIEAFGKLRAVYATPRGADDLETMAQVYYDVLRDVPLQAFWRAVNRYLAGDVEGDTRFWPKPGFLKLLANQNRKSSDQTSTLADAYRAWFRTGYRDDRNDFVACPVCGSVLEERDGRLNVWHDAGRHAEAEVPYAGPRGSTAPLLAQAS